MLIGYHTSHEQFPPSELLKYVQMAERAGFTAAMCSATSILGASARGIADSHGPGLGQPCNQPPIWHRQFIGTALPSCYPRSSRGHPRRPCAYSSSTIFSFRARDATRCNGGEHETAPGAGFRWPGAYAE
jgi:hypothetical protein